MMIDTQRFECLLEALNNEIEDLPHGTVKSNMEDIHSGLYSIFEDVALVDFDAVTKENEILKEYLADRLTYEEKQYFKIKHGIEVGIGYGVTL